jgi:hypothetical protein
VSSTPSLRQRKGHRRAQEPVIEGRAEALALPAVFLNHPLEPDGQRRARSVVRGHPVPREAGPPAELLRDRRVEARLARVGEAHQPLDGGAALRMRPDLGPLVVKLVENGVVRADAG